MKENLPLFCLNIYEKALIRSRSSSYRRQIRQSDQRKETHQLEFDFSIGRLDCPKADGLIFAAGNEGRLLAGVGGHGQDGVRVSDADRQLVR